MAKTDQNKQPMIDVKVHRRVLGFLNAARSPEDLMVPPPNEILLVDERVMEADEALHHDEVHGHPGGKGHPGRKKSEQQADAAPLLNRDLAKRVLRARDDYNPLHGFRHISQLQQIPGFNRAILDRLIKLFSPRFRGKWEVLYDAD
jgi:hypothetical protein